IPRDVSWLRDSKNRVSGVDFSSGHRDLRILAKRSFGGSTSHRGKGGKENCPDFLISAINLL
ncbi:MAG: hypothetical protein ABL876_14685, partial [Chitinophagaceae bacterium]